MGSLVVMFSIVDKFGIVMIDVDKVGVMMVCSYFDLIVIFVLGGKL